MEFEVKLKKYRCERCGKDWIPKKEKKSIVCPKCKSPYWDIPKKKTEN